MDYLLKQSIIRYTFCTGSPIIDTFSRSRPSLAASSNFPASRADVVNPRRGVGLGLWLEPRANRRPRHSAAVTTALGLFLAGLPPCRRRAPPKIAPRALARARRRRCERREAAEPRGSRSLGPRADVGAWDCISDARVHCKTLPCVRMGDLGTQLGFEVLYALDSGRQQCGCRVSNVKCGEPTVSERFRSLLFTFVISSQL